MLFLDAHSSAAAVRSEATYSYGTHTRRKIDTDWNRSNSSQPGINFLYCGSWCENSAWTTWSRHFADQVDAVFSVGSRLNFDDSWPARRTDVISAIDCTRDNVAKLDLDPQRVGSSAGGRIATALAANGAAHRSRQRSRALSPVTSPYRARTDGNHDTSTDKQRKFRDNDATVLAGCFPSPADTDASLHASCWDTGKGNVVEDRAPGADVTPVHLISDGDFISVLTDGVTVETAAGSSALSGARPDIPGHAREGPRLDQTSRLPSQHTCI
nr:alpha/beta hydrolase fold domain-containing protein [Streptomyces sp. SID8379]